MGGCVGVTIRKADGTEVRMCRWTNGLPDFITNVAFVEQDEAHLDSYLQTWADFQADYAANKDTGKYAHNMSDIYAPYPFLAPIEYGLVLIDYQTKQVLSKQGYTAVGHFHCSVSHESEDKERFLAFAERGAVREFRYKHKVITPPGATQLEQALAWMSKGIDIEAYVDLAPFTVIEACQWSWREVQEYVQGMGFAVSDEEQKLWQEAIEQEEQQEQE